MPKSAETSLCQKGWCNIPTLLQFLSILTQKILMLSKRFESSEVDVELGYMCPRGLLGPPAVPLTK